MHDDSKEFIWKAPEFKYYAKSASWYWLSFLVVGILILFAIWQKNLLFIIFIIIAEIAVIIWAKRSPQDIEFKIDKNGIRIGEIKFYPYEDLIGFHIKENPGDASELILKTKSRLHPYIKITILDKDIPEMKDYLKEFLPEIEYEESLSDGIARIIGF